MDLDKPKKISMILQDLRAFSVRFAQMISHPYMRLRVQYFLGKSLLLGSLWLWVMGSYHLIYFALNLSEISSIVVETVLLWGYGGIGFLTICSLVWVLRSQKSFPKYLDNTFELSFRWYNALDKSKRQFWNVPRQTAEDIFKRVRLWKALWNQTSYFLVAGYGLVVLLMLFHLSFPKLTETFRTNAQAILLAHTYTYTLTYEERVNRGVDWSVQYVGDYDTASVYLAEKHVLTLKDQGVGHLSNVKASFNLEVVLSKGRIKKLVLLEITVTPPPVLEAVSVRITHLPTGKTVATQGVKRILIDQPSRITAELLYRVGAVLAKADILAKNIDSESEGTTEQTTEYTTERTKALSYSLNEQVASEHISRMTFTTIIRSSSQITIVATNVYGQTSVAHEIVFVVRENLPPTLTIESPPSSLTLFELQDIPVILTAQDDVALKTLTVFVEARTREDKVLWETKLPYPAKSIRGKTLVEARVLLPLLEKRSPTSTRFIYWAEVKDYAELSSVSSKQVVHYRPKSDFFKQSEEQSTVIENSLNVQNESIENLSKEYDRLEILSEKKILKQKDIKRFEENAANLNERLREDQENILALEETLESKNSLSPALRKKLTRLKATLAQLDKELLQKLTQDSQKLLENFASNVSPEQLREDVKRLDIKRLEQRIDQTLQLLANLKTLQELNNLKELAQNLYERFRDLEGYMVFSDLSDDDINDETHEIQNELRYIAQKFDELEAELPSNPQFDAFKQAIRKDLKPEAIREFEKTARNRKNSVFVQKRSAQLNRIRKNLAALTQSSSAQELENALAELNYQIFTLSEKSFELTQLLMGERYPRRVLQEAFLRKFLSKFSSSEKAMLKSFKDNLEAVGGGGRWDLSVLEKYASYIEKIEAVQRAIDPAAQLRQTRKIKAQAEIINLTTINNELAWLLMALKKNLLQEKASESMQNALADAANNQSGLNRRLDSWLEQRSRQGGAPSSEEDAYLRSLLAEQSYIRELLEQLALGQQPGQQGQSGAGENGTNGTRGDGEQGANGQKTDGNSGKNGKGEGKNGLTEGESGSGASGNGGEGLATANSLRQLTERMRDLEAELIKRNPDLKRVRELKSLIENNLLKHSTGLKKEQEQDDRDDKREAEREFEPYQSREIGKVAQDNLHLIKEKLSELQAKNVYPKEYRAKIEVFFKALRQSLQGVNNVLP